MLVIDDAAAKRQCDKLRQVRAERDNSRVHADLERLRSAAQGHENMMPAILECVRSYATLGEMCDALRAVFGEYREPLFD
jgi:methylmalonyl-CoA mutase N-terminal domain/subunit